MLTSRILASVGGNVPRAMSVTHKPLSWIIGSVTAFVSGTFAEQALEAYSSTGGVLRFLAGLCVFFLVLVLVAGFRV